MLEYLSVIVVSAIFSIGIGISAREDESFAIWKPFALWLGLIIAVILIGKLVALSPGAFFVGWIVGTLLVGGSAAALTRFLFKSPWLHSILAGVFFMVMEYGGMLLFYRFIAPQL